tara:strand:+ start:38796 stop:39086 length:291 start_codon:yes stop_codon:yes gene_type:complete
MTKHSLRLFSKRIGDLSALVASLQEITIEEKAGKEFLGAAYGIDLNHCALLGAKYCQNFHNARWYHVAQDSDRHLEEIRKRQPSTLKIEFYREFSG